MVTRKLSKRTVLSKSSKKTHTTTAAKATGSRHAIHPIKHRGIGTIKKQIARNDLRKYEIQRTSKILKVLPQFVKFYDKLSDSDIRALKFYKGSGSYWQTQLLTDTSKQREIAVPFDIYDEESLRHDIMGNNIVNLLPMSKSLDIKDMSKYIENSLKTRIILLNRLENIFNHKDCPKLTGDEILFRGISIFPELKKKKVGDTIKFKNFMSSTIDRKVAEMFSGNDTLLILSGLKDVPFIYMPNSKKYGNQKFAQFAVNQHASYDFSEFTLPRNLEFKIDAIDVDYISSTNMYWGAQNVSFKKIIKLLTKKGLFHKDNKDTINPLLHPITAAHTVVANNSQANNTDKVLDDNDTIIKQAIFPKLKVYFLSFVKRYKESPITYEQITNNAKFVLDKFAMDSWNPPKNSR